MTAKTITINAKQVTVGDHVVSWGTVESIERDPVTHAITPRFGPPTSCSPITVQPTADLTVTLPRPHRYSVIDQIGKPGPRYLIVDRYHEDEPVMDHDGFPRGSATPSMAVLMRDQLNLAHHLGVQL